MKLENRMHTILVLGGTGKTGRRIVERLNRLEWPVRIGSRSGNPKFNWNDKTTWLTSLIGVDAVYLSFQPDIAVPGSVGIIEEFLNMVVTHGIRNIVLLSGRGEKEAQMAEQTVKSSGINWTILRSSWFNQNFSEGFFLDYIQSGHVALPSGNVKEPFIDANDIADVAVAALTRGGHANKIYELTGPRLLTLKDVINKIADATGRSIQFEDISVKEYAARLTKEGIHPDYIWLVTYLFSEVLDGRNANIGDGVQLALQREPKGFEDYVQNTAATGIWSAQ